MIRRVVRIENERGLHARLAARLVKITSRFQSRIKLGRVGGAEEIDAKSILGILLLAASQGTLLEVTAEGEDESEAVAAIEDLIGNQFGEEK